MTGCSIIYKPNSVEDNEPNSFSCKRMPKYFDVETIPEQLNENTIKNSEREWLFVGADEPPIQYSKII